MTLLRSAAQIFIAAALIGGAVGAAQSQTAGTQSPGLPDGTANAKALADAFNARLLKAQPSASTTFESATSNDNVADVIYVVADVMFFSRLKNALKNAPDQFRRSRASQYCGYFAAYLQGVAIHEVFATSDHSDRVDLTVTFDGSGCDADAEFLLRQFGCKAPRPHFTACPPDDRKCEVASKMHGCITDDILRPKRSAPRF
jgi:hypothetical protein